MSKKQISDGSLRTLGVRFARTPDHFPVDPEVRDWVDSLPEPGTRRWWRVVFDDGEERRVAAHSESDARIFAMRPVDLNIGRAPRVVEVHEEGPVCP